MELRARSVPEQSVNDGGGSRRPGSAARYSVNAARSNDDPGGSKNPAGHAASALFAKVKDAIASIVIDRDARVARKSSETTARRASSRVAILRLLCTPRQRRTMKHANTIETRRARARRMSIRVNDIYLCRESEA